MIAEAVGDQHHADHQEEAERQHDDAGVLVDEVGQRVGGQQHDGHGDQNGDDHDRQVLGHADGRQDRVDREDDVQQDDLEDGRAGVGDDHVLLVHDVVAGRGIDRVVDFLGRLPDQEQTTRDQDQVLPREFIAHDGEDRLHQTDQPGDDRQQGQTHDQRQADTDAPHLLPLMLGQFVRQDRDEDQVVDAEHDLHHDEGHQCSPGGRIGEQGSYAVEHWGSRWWIKLERKALGPTRVPIKRWGAASWSHPPLAQSPFLRCVEGNGGALSPCVIGAPSRNVASGETPCYQAPGLKGAYLRIRPPSCFP